MQKRRFKGRKGAFSERFSLKFNGFARSDPVHPPRTPRPLFYRNGGKRKFQAAFMHRCAADEKTEAVFHFAPYNINIWKDRSVIFSCFPSY